MNTDVLLAVNGIFVLYEVSSSKQYFDFTYYYTEAIKSIFTPSRETIFFYLVVLIDTFPTIISQDLYSDMQRIEACPLDCNLAEITPIRDLP